LNQAASFCAYCGAPLAPEASFCERCGQPVGDRQTGMGGGPPDQPVQPPPPEAYTPPPANTSPLAQPSPPPSQPAPAYNPAPAPASTPPKRRSSTWIWVIIGAVVVGFLCLAALCLLVFFPAVRRGTASTSVTDANASVTMVAQATKPAAVKMVRLASQAKVASPTPVKLLVVTDETFTGGQVALFVSSWNGAFQDDEFF